MKIEDLLPGVRIEVAPPTGSCRTCAGAGKIANPARPPRALAELLDQGRAFRVRKVLERCCPHCWGSGREVVPARTT